MHYKIVFNYRNFTAVLPIKLILIPCVKLMTVPEWVNIPSSLYTKSYCYFKGCFFSYLMDYL